MWQYMHGKSVASQQQDLHPFTCEFEAVMPAVNRTYRAAQLAPGVSMCLHVSWQARQHLQLQV